MLQKNIAGQGVYLYAVDTTATPAIGKTGDAANITGHASLDGGVGASFGTAHPTEIGGGVYWQPLAQGETNGQEVAFYWSSSTTGIVVDPVITSTTAPNFTSLTAAAIATAVMSDVTDTVGADVVSILSKVNTNLDAAVSTRLAATSYTAPDNTDIASTHSLLSGLLATDTTQLSAHALALAPTGGGLTITDVQTAMTDQGYTTTRAANLDNLDAAISAVKTKTDTLPATFPAVDGNGNVRIAGPFKMNAADGFSLRMVQSADHRSPFTAGGVTATRTIAGGASAPVAGTITQVGDTNEYYFAGLAADFSGSSIHFAFTATGADPVYVTIAPTP